MPAAGIGNHKSDSKFVPDSGCKPRVAELGSEIDRITIENHVIESISPPGVPGNKTRLGPMRQKDRTGNTFRMRRILQDVKMTGRMRKPIGHDSHEIDAGWSPESLRQVSCHCDDDALIGQSMGERNLHSGFCQPAECEKNPILSSRSLAGRLNPPRLPLQPVWQLTPVR